MQDNIEAATLFETEKIELLVLSARIRRYKDNLKRKWQNQLFREDERQFYHSLSTKESDQDRGTLLGMVELRNFRSNIWLEPFPTERRG